MFKVSSVQDYKDTLPKRFVASAAKGVKATYQFELAGEGGGTFHVTVDDGTMTLVEGASASPTTTIKMTSDDYVKMVNGELSGPMAFMRGKLKISGNMLLAQKMQAIFPPSK